MEDDEWRSWAAWRARDNDGERFEVAFIGGEGGAITTLICSPSMATLWPSSSVVVDGGSAGNVEGTSNEATEPVTTP